MKHKQVRPNKHYISNTVIEKEVKKPEYVKNAEKVLEILKHNKSGCIMGELYKKAQPMFDRRVREALSRLKATDQITYEKCRCGGASIYKVK